MSLISKYVEVGLGGNNVKYYESLGYKIPRRKDKYGKMVFPKGIKIKVKVEDLQKWSMVKVKVKCDNPYCKKEYEISYNAYNKHNHNGKYYCHKCANSIFNRGENHWQWKPEKTQEEREMQRCYPEYTEFIKKVLARDNYICQCCGNKINHNAEVHHLDGYDWCKEKRIDETNGITLCKACHKNFHSIYGYGNNTKEQFEEWLSKAIKLSKYEGELPKTRKIYCIEEDKVYDSMEQLSNEWNLKTISNIYNVCKHNKHYKSIKGKHLLWLDEYEKCSEEDIQKYLEWCKPNFPNRKYENNPSSKKVICITTGEIFDTIKEASEFYNIYRGCITKNCKNEQKYAGKLLDGTKLIWEYL